jgi:endonuclease III
MEAADDMSADDLAEFHWHLKRLGQNTCKAFQTSCNICPLSESCMKRMDAATARSRRAA